MKRNIILGASIAVDRDRSTNRKRSFQTFPLTRQTLAEEASEDLYEDYDHRASRQRALRITPAASLPYLAEGRGSVCWHRPDSGLEPSRNRLPLPEVPAGRSAYRNVGGLADQV